MKFMAQFQETPDGRPQGPTHPHPHRPRPYDTPIPGAPCIVGAEPIRAYLNGIAHKGGCRATIKALPAALHYTCPPDRIPSPLRTGEHVSNKPTHEHPRLCNSPGP